LNIIEQLLVEHAANRLHLRFIRDSEKNSEFIYELDEFVVKCHARIEDELVFPKLRKTLTETNQEAVEKTLGRIEADHQLIQKISQQIRSATEKGEQEILRKRIMLYCTTLETHNLAEENLIFPHWNSEDEMDAKGIIDEFGRDRYFRITGIQKNCSNLFPDRIHFKKKVIESSTIPGN
jgi:hemerythrin superfamily protein